MHSEHELHRRCPDRRVASPPALRRSARRSLVLAVLLAAVAACSVAPAGEPERSTDAAPTTEVLAPIPPPTSGELRAAVPGVGPGESAAPDEPGAPDHVLLVGDSVLLQITDDIARQVGATLHVDAADCRRIDIDVTGPCGGVPPGAVVADGIEAIEARVGELADDGVSVGAAVLVLANNSSLAPRQLEAAMDALAGIPRVWWVTTRIEGFGRQDPNNARLAELAERDPRAGVIDWYGHSRGEDWLADHVHPTPDGEAALAGLIGRQLRCDCSP